MGGTDNPQQFPNYNPTNDLLLDPQFYAVSSGRYHNDPTFPPPPTNFTDPVINLGPDADEYRDPTDGSIKNASQQGLPLKTFTAHRSPLGLVFDTTGALAPPFQYHGFMLSWTPGDPTGDTVAGPFDDPGQQKLDLNLTKLGKTKYEMYATRIVGGFNNPIDAEIISNKVYVIEYGGNQGLWEITFPPSTHKALPASIILSNGTPGVTFFGVPNFLYNLQRSTNLSPGIGTKLDPPSTSNKHAQRRSISILGQFRRPRIQTQRRLVSPPLAVTGIETESKTFGYPNKSGRNGSRNVTNNIESHIVN